MNSINEKKGLLSQIIKKAKEKLKTAKIDFRFERYDDSVSRSYYAVYHAITAVLFSKEFHYSSHAQTIGGFNKEFIKTGIFPSDFSKIINRLFTERQTGDYDFITYIDRKSAEQDLKDAKMIIKFCEDYLSENFNLFKK